MLFLDIRRLRAWTLAICPVVGRTARLKRRGGFTGREPRYSPCHCNHSVVSTCSYVEEAASLWFLHWRRGRRRKTQYWIHPLIQDRLTHGMYITLYPKLRNHEDKFFNYFRMSTKSFDDLLEVIQVNIATANTKLRDSIFSRRKLFVTIRRVFYCYIHT